MPKMVYIAGKYQGDTHDYRSYCQIDLHINEARKAAVWCANNGLDFFCPHLHSAHFEVICPEVPAEFWYALDNRFLDMCDGIVLLYGWEESVGARAECIRMQALNRPTFVFPLGQARLLAWAKEDA